MYRCHTFSVCLLWKPNRKNMPLMMMIVSRGNKTNSIHVPQICPSASLSKIQTDANIKHFDHPIESMYCSLLSRVVWTVLDTIFMLLVIETATLVELNVFEQHVNEKKWITDRDTPPSNGSRTTVQPGTSMSRTVFCLSQGFKLHHHLGVHVYISFCHSHILLSSLLYASLLEILYYCITAFTFQDGLLVLQVPGPVDHSFLSQGLH